MASPQQAPPPSPTGNPNYWDMVADEYHRETLISTDDFHYGPLVPGDSQLGLIRRELRGGRCLELGCGGAENSIFLARQGWTCLAIDNSAAQLEFARRQAAACGVEVELIHGMIEDTGKLAAGEFDLIHSSYALAFVEEPAAAIAAAAGLLRPGGQMLVSTGHPLAAAEWLELDDGAQGALVTNYFSPTSDLRHDQFGVETARARFHPIGEMHRWFTSAGLQVRDILEPMAAAPPGGGHKLAAAKKIMPYHSRDWLKLYRQFRHVPVVAIFDCAKY